MCTSRAWAGSKSSLPTADVEFAEVIVTWGRETVFRRRKHRRVRSVTSCHASRSGAIEAPHLERDVYLCIRRSPMNR
jgi:hypothetical protein